MARVRPQELGRWGEGLACLFLETCGFVCLDRRFRKQWGEIDLVMRRDSLLIFVEVKLRRGRRCGRPEEAITRRKLQRIRRLASIYLQERLETGIESFRFDLVAIEFNGNGREMHLRHHAGIC